LRFRHKVFLNASIKGSEAAEGMLRGSGFHDALAALELWLTLHALTMAVLVIAGGRSAAAVMQQPVSLSANEAHLPDAPGRGGAAPAQSRNEEESLGSIRGMVQNINGVVVANATVTLANHGESNERVTLSDAEGRFTFFGVTPGSIHFTITSEGLETFSSQNILLHAGEQYEAPAIRLPIAATTTDVQVTVTQHEVAQEQMEAEEKQRVLGIIPNFYSSYIWHAAPLSPQQKFELAFRSTLDPVGFLTSGVTAGIEQSMNKFPGYGQDAQGYAKRYGASYATGAIGRMIGSAVLPSLLHQDPRYFYKGSGSIHSRMLYALSAAAICKGDNGRWQPNYSHVLGNLAAGGFSNLYHPASDRGVMLTIDNALIGTAAEAAGNVVREFLLRKLTPGVPGYANGKP
jgi:hypothetical protein